MRVVFNLLPTMKPKTGVGHYAARLFDALGDHLPDGTLHAFPTGRLAAAVRRVRRPRAGGPPGARRMPAPIGWAAEAVRQALRSAGRGCLGLAFRAACHGGGFDLYHEPNFIPFAGGPPAVATVHDLSVILHPEWHPADRVRYHERCFRRGLADVRRIITVSEFVRRQVIGHLGISPTRVTAVPNGVGPEYIAAGPAEAERARRELGLPPEYLLYVGTIEPRKNVLTLLRAYTALPTDLRAKCPLVLAGGWGWKSEEVADYYQRVASTAGVRLLGYMADSLLPGVFAGARALVYPSFYEGFGLPPLEMLACGGVVLSSTADALREVVGGHAHFIEPLDLDGWRDAMTRAISDDEWLRGLRAGSRERAARFGWQRCAAETAAVYRTLLAPVRQAA
jgi:alpha-1,3-rhamnosyl/mannosyltransferase